jgi:enoyl reductase
MSKAVSYARCGGPEVLEVIDVPEPQAGAGQVRVAVRAAGLNAFDFKLRRDPSIMPSHTLPSRQGSEFSGVIDELGEGVSGLTVGDEVLGWAPLNAQAEFVVVSAKNVAAKPPTLEWASAGGLYSVGNTAIRSTDAVAPTATDTVLVSAAAGGVGILAAQFALRAGATVIGTASEDNHDFLRGLGIIPVSYGPGLADRIRAVAPQGITAAIDNAGEETVLVALELGVAPGRINSIVYFEGAEKYGISVVGSGKKTSAELWELATLVASGELVLPIAATYPLAQVREAYERLESRHLRGKVVLLIE